MAVGTVDNYGKRRSCNSGVYKCATVLDENAEARYVRRLFIADNSALANGIGGPNPTLTTQALATRTAEKISQRHFGGEGWVRKQAPISSIDAVVTQAVIKRELSGMKKHKSVAALASLPGTTGHEAGH